ncbi:MAG: hypothetical protein CM15mP40_12420 [Alphaproteobacteria bacterium]|nr:MAG: hypothetical protein CM15mP40_12420 [Alphaproteobacteria bacterium]
MLHSTDENGRVWIYYGDSDAGKVKKVNQGIM